MAHRPERSENGVGEESMLLVLKKLHAAMEQYGKEQLESWRLSPSQGLILGYLFSKDGEIVYSVDLHAHLGISKSAISSELKKLRGDGYLVLRENPGDDRKKRIELTGKALEIRKAFDESFRSREELVCRGIDRESLAVTRECLLRMRENLKQECGRRTTHG